MRKRRLQLKNRKPLLPQRLGQLLGLLLWRRLQRVLHSLLLRQQLSLPQRSLLHR